jgi:hypothetical protein
MLRFLNLTGDSDLSLFQRWSTYLTLFLAIAMLGFAINMRDRIQFRAVFYEETTTGIRALYPANWLIDNAPPDYIFRIRDMQYVGFKTTIQVTIVPISPQTTERNVADQLALQRSQILTDYRQLSFEDYTLRGIEGQFVSYTFVSREDSPFLESIPTVVIGNDIIIISRGQAIVITFHANTNNFDDKYPYFQRFLNSLEF